MEWKKKDDGSYEAKGKKGTFVIWKERSRWEVRYTASVGYNTFAFHKETLKDAKAACERNFYWEKVV